MRKATRREWAGKGGNGRRQTPGPDLTTAAGTTVGKLNATDRDQPGTNHVKIRYTLLDGLDLFSIQPNTGVITTVTDSLDREVNPDTFAHLPITRFNFVAFVSPRQTKDKYLVTVKIQDMAGASSGLSNTGTATIVVGDINDNPPTFVKTSVSDRHIRGGVVNSPRPNLSLEFSRSLVRHQREGERNGQAHPANPGGRQGFGEHAQLGF